MGQVSDTTRLQGESPSTQLNGLGRYCGTIVQCHVHLLLISSALRAIQPMPELAAPRCSIYHGLVAYVPRWAMAE
jgi:hypothetical protein